MQCTIEGEKVRPWELMTNTCHPATAEEEKKFPFTSFSSTACEQSALAC